MIRLFNVSKRYNDVTAVEGATLEVARGEFVFLTGPSGAGKTTLLRMMLRQELPSTGQILVNGRNVGALPAAKIPDLRRSIGVVFQDFKLIQRKTALDNVAYVLNVAGVPRSQQRKKAYEALRSVGLNHKLSAFPSALSGGEQQRVAIARAVVNEPALLLADEPTGNLDPKTADQVLDLLLEMNRVHGTALVVVTHSPEIAARLGRRVVLVDGYLEEPGVPRPETS